MSTDIIRKGWLEVKKKNAKLGPAYKHKFVILRNSSVLRCKTVEIQDNEEAEETGEIIPLGEIWTVQDKPSKRKGRYGFELIMGEEAVLTFCCPSVVDREMWSESFRILMQLTSPYAVGQASSASDFFSVTLVKNRSALEIGHSGQYLLSFKENTVVLHWRTGAIAHHWPQRSVVKFAIDHEREGHLLLFANRITGSGPQMEFEFTTEIASARQIMKLWSISLMESASPGKRNELSSFLNTKNKLKHPERKSKSFRARKTGREVSDDLKRSGSLSRSHTLGAKRGPIPPPLPTGGRGQLTDTSGVLHTNGANLSQDSFFSFQPRYNTSPPPLPATPDSSDEDDPDYAYIDENKVKGPGNVGKRPPSPTVEDQLKAIERDIRRENKAKKREEERMKTLRPGMPAGRDRSPVSFGPKMDFVPADPSDYIEPVPSARVQLGQSLTQPSDDLNGGYEVPMSLQIRATRRTHSESDSAPLSQPIQSFNGVGLLKDHLPTREEYLPRVPSAKGGLENAPILPPRPWRNNSTTSVNSVTSSGSGSYNRNSTGATMTSVETIDSAAIFQPRAYRISTSSDDPMSPRARDSLHESTIPEEPLDSPPARTGGASHSPPRLSVSPEKELSHSHSSSPPPLPPRSPLKEHVSRQSSSSSTTSARCPRCRTRSIHRSTVGKTSSLNEHQLPLTPHYHRDSSTKGSLPDLNKSLSVPDGTTETTRHRHSSGSPSSSIYIDTLPAGTSAANFEYLQLLRHEGEEEADQSPTSPQSQMDILSSLSQTLDLDHMRQDVRIPHGQTARDLDEQKKSIQTIMDAALRLTQQVQEDLSQPARQPVPSADLRKFHVPNGHTPSPRMVRPPPLLKHKTIATLPSLSSSSPHSHMNGSTPHHLISPPASARPPVPPRSLVSLGVEGQPSPRYGRASTIHGLHRNRAPDSESSTVFIHHLRRSATKL